jgi:hypothetical protein
VWVEVHVLTPGRRKRKKKKKKKKGVAGHTHAAMMTLH